MVNERVRAYIKIVYKNKIVMGIISKSVRLEKVCNCNETFYNGLKSEKKLHFNNYYQIFSNHSQQSVSRRNVLRSLEDYTELCRIINFWFENSA